jgi:hypothetical protein
MFSGWSAAWNFRFNSRQLPKDEHNRMLAVR